ncbi:MAG: Ig-like domain-containing protein [Microthrixaceae bacterium]
MGSKRLRVVVGALVAVALAALVLAVDPGEGIAAAATGPQFPDLQTVIPTTAFSVVGTGATREFRYTHLVYNAGPGPLEIQPSYNPSSGDFEGTQQVYGVDATGNWSLASEAPVPDHFVFHAEHGHFHFPLAAFGLYAVNPDGSPGAAVALSPKVGFCISDSYIYDSTVPNAGKFVGTQGSCADPLTLRGMSVGGADEYDYRDPGQAIPIPNVPDGTYWFRAMSDPNNDFAEANEANNEMDVKVTISNGVVTTGTVARPDTTPPAVTLTSPATATRVAGTVNLGATSGAGTAPVQFLVDGVVVGVGAGGSTQSYPWDSSRVVDGTHSISARVTDAKGRVNTSKVATVQVLNSPPTGGSLVVDGIAGRDGSTTVTTPGIVTTQSGDLLLALVSADGPTSSAQTATVTGGGLTWKLARRTNTQAGTSEVWWAKATGGSNGLTVTSTLGRSGFDQSLTVVALAGAAGVGATAGAAAASGAPGVSLTATAAGSMAFAAGNDWDAAVPRTLASGQVMVRQWVDNLVGDTFWSQRTDRPSTAVGSTLTVADTAPTADRWNLAAVEVVPATAPVADTTKPQVTVTEPPAGKTITGIVPVAASAVDNVGVASVRFKVDGVLVGSAVTTPPFQTSWDTRAVANGAHTLTAEATDPSGNVGVSAPVSVTVDNSAAPPAVIKVDAQVNRRARGALTSPALTTPTPGDLLVAFVSFDGPNGANGQSATVTGAGLTWSLVKRSSSQGGVSEIWAARVPTTLSNATVTATPARGGYDGMLTVLAFSGADSAGVAGASGAPSGAPDIYLPGVPTGAWVFAVGNDWDGSVARVPVAGQTLVQQWLDSAVGDTFWVQSMAAPSVAPGLVTIHDSAPTNHQWNYAAVAIIPKAGTAATPVSALATPLSVSPAIWQSDSGSTGGGFYCDLTRARLD